VIRFEQVTVTYPGADRPVLRGVDLRVADGELCCVLGRTGAGKSTLLRAVNGLVPRSTGGRLSGRVTVAGRSTADHPPRELADVVGYVGQDPPAGFVTDTVEDEIAYGMEQLAVPAEVMRTRVEELLDLLGIAELRGRALRTLSGGQQQRVAIAAALAPGPRVLVLDEPTSALDPTAAEEVLAALVRLVHDLGTTVLVAEHRLERVVQYADRVAVLHGDGTVEQGDPAGLLATAPVAPPVVQLGRLAGWSPLPLSVRDARRRAGELRDRLGGRRPAGRGHGLGPVDRPAALVARDLTVTYGPVAAVRGVDLGLLPGEVTALMGRNGSGKTSLLWALQGSGPRRRGSVEAAGADPARLAPAERRRRVALVPQTPGDLLYLDTVDAECAQADVESGVASGTCRRLLDGLTPAPLAGTAHPRDLSEGQRLALVLAVQLCAAAPVVLLDEPTRGLDYGAKDALGALLRRLAAEGRAVLVSTHDVEFVAATADRCVVMAQGEIVADGPTAEVVASSPMLAPQVAKVLHPDPWLTVDELRDALGPVPA
jgi:energy-coupling factor transport system ATP-binding protein